ncbi:Metal-dependent hydrolase, endonuclease/exonuclease/phosphatase family [Arcanobacterium phocae]|uniref:Metal-dependent hydrolase, endonuclease/exonuclease/phosphatase family n=1 Tax=Arcanobacterium phocae TaxID=131112 RepID=A0A1H2LAZ0_9ACTO|nr:endonuclease/exonuclease/phosphatase family protein [Arcanobacterium phocae]SDU77895.1 Metal-dependent hydrolase, endonuclease/exonuclease/phosphatase family [Arcanobacterium phocae]
MSLRCVTLNLEHGRPARENHEGAFAQAVVQLQDLAPDLMMVQEADGPFRARFTTGSTERGGQIQILAKRLNMTYAYAPSAFGYGVGILSRLPIRAARYLRLPPIVKPIYHKPDESWKIRWPEPRVALYAQLDAGTQPLLVGTTHLDIDQQAAPCQLQIVAQGFEHVATMWGIPGGAASSSILLSGDMNLRPDAVADALAKIPETTTAPRTVLATELTYPHTEPRWQIDHMLGHRIVAQYSRSLSTSISDHAGLIIEADLN